MRAQVERGARLLPARGGFGHDRLDAGGANRLGHFFHFQSATPAGHDDAPDHESASFFQSMPRKLLLREASTCSSAPYRLAPRMHSHINASSPLTMMPRHILTAEAPPTASS